MGPAPEATPNARAIGRVEIAAVRPRKQIPAQVFEMDLIKYTHHFVINLEWRVALSTIGSSNHIGTGILGKGLRA